MCLMVREGEYPPPDDYVKSEPLLTKIWHGIKTYAANASAGHCS